MEAETEDEEDVEDVEQEIKRLRREIKRIKKLYVGHADRAELPGLQMQLGALLMQQAQAGEATSSTVIQNLEQRVARMEMTAAPYISPRSVAHIKGAIFLIKGEASLGSAKPARLTSVALKAHESPSKLAKMEAFDGSGFFFKSADLAVTPAHQLTEAQKAGTAGVEILVPATDKHKTLRVFSHDDKVDIAYLKSVTPDPSQAFLEADSAKPDEIIGAQAVLFTTNIALQKQFASEPGQVQISQRIGKITSVWDTRFTYAASTYPGDCGCPIMIRGDKVLGIHVEMVNAVEGGISVKSLSASMNSSGPHDAVGLFVGAFPDLPVSHAVA
uniref:Uncharacterized protein n=1 Tax=Chlamydomonas leiostraca TaxID=1034604 RepID=A0A7S0WPI7_9CHLO|mmetsp:Transcript_21873/g.55647  ORF Transcript_21873/g.55647 Transcript_21873/m.55647 type:complete len:329 (+) Transcript_21873:280-1266(+)